MCQTHLTELQALWVRLPGDNELSGENTSFAAGDSVATADSAVVDVEQFTKTSAAPSEEGLAADTPVVSELLDRDPRMAAIVDQFVIRLRSQVEAMQEALREERFSDLALLAHWLKGSGGNVGFKGVVQLAADLQQFAKAEDLAGANSALNAVEAYTTRIERGRDSAFLNRSA